MSTQRASETPSITAEPAIARTVLLPGSPATYANGSVLREMGLRWDPVGHRWHGRATTEVVKTLRERLGLEVRCFGDLEVPPKRPTVPKPTPPGPALGPIAVPARDPARRPHDGSRTRAEARVAFPPLSGEPDEIETPTRPFNLLEITSGLSDDSREADEKLAERHLRERRGRVRRARAVVVTTPGLAEILHANWKKAARFYARFAITEEMLRRGVPAGDRAGEYVATKT